MQTILESNASVFGITDNERVMEIFRNMIADTVTLPKQCMRQWMAICNGLVHNANQFGTSWVPAHDKQSK